MLDEQRDWAEWNKNSEPATASSNAGTDAAGDRMAAIGRLIAAQDNRITHAPIFAVQQRKRIYGVDPEYTDNAAWLDAADGEAAGERESERLEGLHRRTGQTESGDWRRVGYVDEWEFVTACFTEQGCEDFIRTSGISLTEPRIYAYSGFRNQEWQDVRDFLIAAGKGAAAEPAKAMDESEIEAKWPAVRGAVADRLRPQLYDVVYRTTGDAPETLAPILEGVLKVIEDEFGSVAPEVEQLRIARKVLECIANGGEVARDLAQAALEAMQSAEPDAERNCGNCHACTADMMNEESGLPMNAVRFIVCASCGNKRCPRATDHRNACTGSNEPGQSGSIYGPPGEMENIRAWWMNMTTEQQRSNLIRRDPSTCPCGNGGAPGHADRWCMPHPEWLHAAPTTYASVADLLDEAVASITPNCNPRSMPEAVGLMRWLSSELRKLQPVSALTVEPVAYRVETVWDGELQGDIRLMDATGRTDKLVERYRQQTGDLTYRVTPLYAAKEADNPSNAAPEGAEVNDG